MRKKILDDAKTVVRDLRALTPDRLLWRVTLLALFPSAFLVGGAAAQIDTLTSAICDTGAWQVIAIVLAAISLYILFKGIVQVLMGADKMTSGRDQDKYEGREKAKGGGTKIGVAIFGIPIIAVMLDAIGIVTISCVDWGSVSLLGGGGGGAEGTIAVSPETIQTAVDIGIALL